MATPAWLTATFAALMLTVAAYCSARPLAARRRRKPTHLDTDATHIFMGVAMAGMLVARLRILPAPAWEAIFALALTWFATQTIRARRATPAIPWRCFHPTPHLVECAAMLFMLAAPPARALAAAPMSAMPAPRYSYLALPLALYLLAHAVRITDRLTAPAPVLATPSKPSASAAPVPAHPHLAPRCAALCKIAMGLTMGYMLILML